MAHCEVMLLHVPNLCSYPDSEWTVHMSPCPWLPVSTPLYPTVYELVQLEASDVVRCHRDANVTLESQIITGVHLMSYQDMYKDLAIPVW